MTKTYTSQCRCCRQQKPRRGGRRIVEDGVELYVCADCKRQHLEPLAARHRQELAQVLHQMFFPLFRNN